MLETHGDIGVRIPNDIFFRLSSTIKNKNGSINIQQVAFSYSYIALNAFLSKYAHYVDITNGVYVQTGDIKQLLGYSRTTKSIDKIIKKNGVLEDMGLIRTSSDYPLFLTIDKTEKINDTFIHDYVMSSNIDDNEIKQKLKSIVKNRNYEVKEPTFLFEPYGDNDYGTVYEIKKTHEIMLSELIRFIDDANLDNIDCLIYFYIKSRCKGYQHNKKQMTLYKMIAEIGIDRSSFYSHLKVLKLLGFISVSHASWKPPTAGEDSVMASNEYQWIGIHKY